VDQLPSIRVLPPGPQSRAMAVRSAAVDCPVFDVRRQERTQQSGEEQATIVYARGHGSIVECVDGNRYLDLVAGFGALCLGYGDAARHAAITAQTDTLELALGDVYASDIKIAAQERIASLMGDGAKVMLGSSGADAVTAAMKTVQLASSKPGLIAFVGGYHGLTHGPLAALGLAAKYRTPFAASLSPHVEFVPYPTPDPSDVSRVLEAMHPLLKTGRIGGVLVEPILGRGGCVVPPAAFLPEVRELCTRFGAYMIADEVWTGCGRSGRWMWSADAKPDVVCFGKALGGGSAVSACVGTSDIMQAWARHGGSAIHTATHFGSPTAAAAVVATLDALSSRGLVVKAQVDGDWFQAQLRAAGFQVRGAGLMIGVVLENGARALAVASQLLRRGFIVLTGGSANNVLTLTPALTISRPQLSAFVAALSDICAQPAS
jgi:4-aminobutyrate aminotransferase / (S)-3-amino-2-methylpropionate transaminase / 5-aminovalerate transaminase